MKLDRIDLKILTILQKDGRITNKALAEKVGLSPRPCLERLRWLLKSGYIRSISAQLHPQKFANPVTVYAHVALASQDRHLQERFEAHITQIEEAVDCAEVSGNTDYLVRFLCPTLDDYYKITNDLLENDRLGVRRIDSTIVLRSVFPQRPLPTSILDRALD